MAQRRQVGSGRALAQHLLHRIARHQVDEQKHHRHDQPDDRQDIEQPLQQRYQVNRLTLALTGMNRCDCSGFLVVLFPCRRGAVQPFHAYLADAMIFHFHYRKPSSLKVHGLFAGREFFPGASAGTLPVSPLRRCAASASSSASPGRAGLSRHPAAQRPT